MVQVTQRVMATRFRAGSLTIAPRAGCLAFVGCVLLIVGTGCPPANSHMLLVPDNALGKPAAPARTVTQASFAPASTEAAASVDRIGRQVLTANPQIGMQPLFRTIGAPHAEVFHRGTKEVHITEGLVRQCTTDGMLAAVLSTELGKMVSEREALAHPRMRAPDRQPPISVPIGNDTGGPFGSADGVRLAELGRHERERPRPTSAPSLPPDPQTLARLYLTSARFPASELEAVAPLLQAAAAAGVLEQQNIPEVPQAKP